MAQKTVAVLPTQIVKHEQESLKISIYLSFLEHSLRIDFFAFRTAR